MDKNVKIAKKLVMLAKIMIAENDQQAEMEAWKRT